MAESKKQTQSENRDGLALIIGGLLVLALVFGTYAYFNRKTTTDGATNSEEVLSTNDKREDENQNTAEGEEKQSIGDKIKDFFGLGDDEAAMVEETNEEGDLNGKGAKTTDEMDSTATGTGGQGMWEATDYKQGDISGTNYTVKDGDTLWEIAEAKYGNGAEWTRILEANSANIEFLPNGQQALIEVGQTLILPN